MERGEGGTLSVELWQQVAIVLNLPLDLSLARDALEEPVDAGHLRVQELVLRFGRLSGYGRTYELPAKPSNPLFSTDVGLTDVANRRLVQLECVNTFGNINAGIRSSDRKRAEAEQLAVAVGHDQPYAVHLGRSRHQAQSGPARPLSGAVRDAVPRLIQDVGQGAEHGLAAAQGARPDLVRRARHPTVRVAVPRARLGRP